MNERGVTDLEKEEVQNFMKLVYDDIIVGLKIEKIPNYFSQDYIQVTDGIRSDFLGFKNHIQALKNTVTSLTYLPFYDFLFDRELQKVTLRYTVNVQKKNGSIGKIEVIAIFQLNENKILSCHELTHPLKDNKQFQDLGSVS